MSCRGEGRIRRSSSIKWVYRIATGGALAAGALQIVAVSLTLLWSHGVPLSDEHRTALAVIMAVAIFLVLVAFFCLAALAVRVIWIVPKRKAVLEEMIDTDEGHAQALMGCSETRLSHTRDWLSA